MASISISGSGNEVTISIDSNDWSNIVVNGQTVAAGGSWTGALPATFYGKYSGGNVVNPGNCLLVSGPTTSYMALIGYQQQPENVWVSGTIVEVPGPATSSSARLGQTLKFSQPHMNGTFTAN